MPPTVFRFLSRLSLGGRNWVAKLVQSLQMLCGRFPPAHPREIPYRQRPAAIVEVCSCKLDRAKTDEALRISSVVYVVRLQRSVRVPNGVPVRKPITRHFQSLSSPFQPLSDPPARHPPTRVLKLKRRRTVPRSEAHLTDPSKPKRTQHPAARS